MNEVALIDVLRHHGFGGRLATIFADHIIKIARRMQEWDRMLTDSDRCLAYAHVGDRCNNDRRRGVLFCIGHMLSLRDTASHCAKMKANDEFRLLFRGFGEDFFIPSYVRRNTRDVRKFDRIFRSRIPK